MPTEAELQREADPTKPCPLSSRDDHRDDLCGRCKLHELYKTMKTEHERIVFMAHDRIEHFVEVIADISLQLEDARLDLNTQCGVAMDWGRSTPKGWFCAHCGEEHNETSPGNEEAVRAHQWICPKHPMRTLEAEIKRMRRLLWLRHGGLKHIEHLLYGDDGEMNCNTCMIDFKRLSAAEIEQAFVQRGLEQLVDAARAEKAKADTKADTKADK